MPRIVGRDSDIVRRMFLEATQTVGCTAVFHELKSATSDLYNDPDTLYYPPVVLDILLDENPKVKMLKDLGWYNEDEEIRPLLIYLPIYKNQDKDLLNVRENCLIEVVYMGVNTRSTFRISSKRLDSIYGNYWVCKCVPERRISFIYDPSDGHEFLTTGRIITVSDDITVAESSDPSMYASDSGVGTSSLNECVSETISSDEGTSLSSLDLSGDSRSLDIGIVDDLTSLGINAQDSGEMSSFFGDLLAENTSFDEGVVVSVVANTEADSVQTEVLGSDDYASLVMGE
jgi:hypothetical protein